LKKENYSMRRSAPAVLSVVTLVTGYLLILYDDLYGPQDDVLYLWIFLLMLLMASAACILLYQVGAYIFRWAWPRLVPSAKAAGHGEDVELAQPFTP
jgi:hypothetical protein